MADKKTELAIVIRTVDQATAAIRKVRSQLDQLTKPTREGLAGLGGGIAGTLKEVASSVWGTLGKIGEGISDAIKGIAVVGAIVGGTIGGAVAALVHLVDKFDDLGKAAQRLGVGVDYLADLRYAAEKTGVPVEALDQSFLAFSENLGQARAGTGRMAKFLERVYPPLLNSLKGAKSNAEAFAILADAMSKLQDPAKRAALAQKTVGDAALAPLLARGASGIAQLAAEHQDLAGSMKDAVAASDEAHASMVELRAAIDGAEAGIVVGLAPALKIIVERLSEWFVAHREDIKEWAKKIGDELPGAVSKVVDAIKSAVAWLEKAFDAVSKLVDKLGGLQKIFDTVTAGTNILTKGFEWSPVGNARSLGSEGSPADVARQVSERFKQQEKPQVDTSSLFDRADVTGSATAARDADQSRAAALVAAALAGNQVAVPGGGKSEITVNFAGAPRGTRVTTDPKSDHDINVNVGYQTAPGLP